MSDLSVDHLLDAKAVVRDHALNRIEYVRRTIAEIELQTSALLMVIADLNRIGADTTEAEQRLLTEMDRLLDLRLDEGSLLFLTSKSW